MARYIDADKLTEALNEFDMEETDNASYDCGYEDCFIAIQDTISDIPTADVVEVKQIEIIRADLKWWLKTNTEKGVVYIPKFVVENMVAKMNLSELPTD